MACSAMACGARVAPRPSWWAVSKENMDSFEQNGVVFKYAGNCICGEPVFFNTEHGALAHRAPECELYKRYADPEEYLRALNIALGIYKAPKTGEA